MSQNEAKTFRARLKAARKLWQSGGGFKAGAMAGYVHREAQAHAQVSPHRAAKAPTTERELSLRLREIAYEAQQAMSAQIRQTLARGIGRVDPQMRDLRSELRQIVVDLDGATKAASRDMVRMAYGVGAGYTHERLDRIGVEPIEEGPFSVSFTLPDRAAMAAIANDLHTDLAGQAHLMSDVAIGILRTEAGRVLTSAIARGSHPADAAKELEYHLTRRGFDESGAMKDFNMARDEHKNPYSGALPTRQVTTTAEAAAWIANDGPLKFIDRAGREWDLADYCEMAAHTKLMIAKNEGVRNTMLDAGVTLYMVSNDGSECPICRPHEGQIYWTGVGESYGYQVGPDIPLHPRCGHTTIPWVQV